ncbi:hypothetical protein ANTRET_LOCUS10966 [Anthophora retusa]
MFESCARERWRDFRGVDERTLPSPTSLYRSTLYYTDESFEYFKGCETLKQPWNTCALVAPTSGTARRNLGYPR